MSLDAVLSNASSGLANVNRALALVSQNVANAGTPGYAREIAAQTSVVAGDRGMGVRSLPATRDIDTALQAATFQQNATVANLQTQQAALQAIDAVHGTPGQGDDLPSLLGGLHDAFAALQGDPSNQARQQETVQAAATLASGINRLSQAYTQQRAASQTDLAKAVAGLNQQLMTMGGLNARIVAQRAMGSDTADLENQRDAVMTNLSGLLDVKFLAQPNGDMIVATPTGLQLPTSAQQGTIAAPDASPQPGAYYPGGGVPAVTLNGVDITPSLRGGRIGADLTVRDVTLPTWQAELDEFAQGVAQRFSAQGLALFTDPGGTVPAGGGLPAQSGYVGFAGIVQVNPAVLTNGALVRDGSTAVAGSPSGASAFTPNPPGGPAGFSGLIDRVLTFSFGASVQAGVAQPAVNTSGLGPGGTLATPYAAPATLAEFAVAMVATQSDGSAQISADLQTQTALSTSLNARLSSGSGVNIDTEMSAMVALQNAYGANARIITAIQAMFTQLLSIVP